MHVSGRIHDHGQMLGLTTCLEHVKFLTNYTASRESLLGQSQKFRLETRSYHVFQVRTAVHGSSKIRLCRLRR